MTQYNANPNPTSSTTGYNDSQGVVTIAATADGLRLTKPAEAEGTNRIVRVTGTVPSGVVGVAANWMVRRNTSDSFAPLGIGYLNHTTLTYTWSSGPTEGSVGAWIRYPNVESTPSASKSYAIRLPAGKVDITLKNMYVYDEPSAPAGGVLSSSTDAVWTNTSTDNTLSVTFQHNHAHSTALNRFTWDWGHGSPTVVDRSDNGSLSFVHQAPALVHNFPTAGLYDVELKVEHVQPTTSPSTTRSVVFMVPTGPFVADYTHSESSLNLSVNAGISSVPTYDTISSYTWEWGDGTPNGSGVTANHTYAEPGTYAVKLTTRTPATLRESTKTYNIVVELPPTPPADLTEAIAKSIFTGRFSSWDVGTRVEELPTPTDFSFAVPADDMPSLTMTYSLKGENGDKVRDLVGEEYDLAFEVFNPTDYQWFEPRGCRWVVQDDDLNLMDATGMVKLRAVGVANDLDGIIVTARESASVGRTFKTADGDVNAGRIMGTLLEGEVLEFDHVITRDFTNTHDSSSTAFSKELNSNYEVGASQTFLQVLQDLTEMGLCHWSTRGNELLLFDDGSPEYGLDLAFGGADDVYLLPGREIKAIQTSRSRRDYLHTLYIPRSDGTFYKREVATPVSRRGKKAQLITGNAVATSGDADLVAGSVLNNAGKITREQYTYELNLSSRLGEGGALPFVDYNPGDLVWAIGATGGLEPMQVQQITLEGGAGKPLEGSVILADRILLQSVQRAKNTARALGSGAHYTNTIVGRTTVETPSIAMYRNATWTHNSSGNYLTVPFTTTDMARGGITYSGGIFTVPVGGVYLVTCGIWWSASATGARYIRIMRNGSLWLRTGPLSGSIALQNFATTVIQCAAGDQISLEAYQNSGGNLVAAGDGNRPTYMQIAKIGD